MTDKEDAELQRPEPGSIELPDFEDIGIIPWWEISIGNCVVCNGPVYAVSELEYHRARRANAPVMCKGCGW